MPGLHDRYYKKLAWDYSCDVNINARESLYTIVDILIFMETKYSRIDPVKFVEDSL